MGRDAGEEGPALGGREATREDRTGQRRGDAEAGERERMARQPQQRLQEVGGDIVEALDERVEERGPAPAALALADEPRAASFVATVLGSFAEAAEELRESVRVYLQQDSSATRAAKLLHVHRNTVLQRLERAEAMLPRPIRGNGLEVRLALELLRWTG